MRANTPLSENGSSNGVPTASWILPIKPRCRRKGKKKNHHIKLRSEVGKASITAEGGVQHFTMETVYGSRGCLHLRPPPR